MNKIFNYFAVSNINAGDAGIPQLDPGVVFTNIMNLIFFVSGVIAVITIIVAGYYYVTSAGSPDSVKRAKDMIIYGVIGLVVVLGAFAILNFVVGSFK